MVKAAPSTTAPCHPVTRRAWCQSVGVRGVAGVAWGWAGQLLVQPAAAAAPEAVIRYFPVGSIYEYRWRLLELALSQTRGSDGAFRLIPFPEDVTQNRGISALEMGELEVIALGTNVERESRMQPVKIDILRGIVGFRLLVIRSADQARIAAMDDASLRKSLTFGLNSQWADLPILRENGYAVTTSSGYDTLFEMLAARRFDAFPRGLNEARRELESRSASYPQLAVEKTLALFFPFPIYFWVRRGNDALARRIERGLTLAMADGSFRRLFETYHASEIAAIKKEKRRVIRLDSPILPPGSPPVDTSWWWNDDAVRR